MGRILSFFTDGIFKSRIHSKIIVQSLLAVLGLFVVVCVFAFYTRSALTLDTSPVCGVEEHVHTDECYMLACGTDVNSAGEDIPASSEYIAESETAQLIAEEAETAEPANEDMETEIETTAGNTEETTAAEAVHAHTENCYVLICAKNLHTHIKECYPAETQEPETETEAIAPSTAPPEENPVVIPDEYTSAESGLFDLDNFLEEINITGSDGNVITVSKEKAADGSIITDINGNAVTAVVKNGERLKSIDDYVFYAGETYSFRFVFAELQDLQFEYNAEGNLIYQLPSGFYIPEESENKIIADADAIIIGTYDINSENLAEMRFNEYFLENNQDILFYLNLNAQIQTEENEKNKEIDFSGILINFEIKELEEEIFDIPNDGDDEIEEIEEDIKENDDNDKEEEILEPNLIEEDDDEEIEEEVKEGEDDSEEEVEATEEDEENEEIEELEEKNDDDDDEIEEIEDEVEETKEDEEDEEVEEIEEELEEEDEEILEPNLIEEEDEEEIEEIAENTPVMQRRQQMAMAAAVPVSADDRPKLYKTINGADFDPDDAKQIELAGTKYDIYKHPRTEGDEPYTTGTLNANGEIEFDLVLEEGEYTIFEKYTNTHVNFPVASTQQVTVDGMDRITTTNRYISDATYGTLVSVSASEAEQNNLNWALPNVWDERLAADSNFATLKAMGAQWIWNTANTYQFGTAGGIFETKIKVYVEETIGVDFYFAADNVAAVYVNGKLAFWTDTALDGRGLSENYSPDVFGEFDFKNFDGRWDEGWAHVYEKELKLTAGDNEIIIIAANSARTANTGTENDGYDTTNNPCGVIFGFELESSTFNNRVKFTPPDTPVPPAKPKLPETGGPGTAIPFISGTAITAGAATFIYFRRKIRKIV